MRKLTYYVSATLDGYIAAPDGGFDFFPFEGDFAEAVLAELPETMPAQAREPLGVAGAANKRFDTVVMGRGTYEPGLKIGLTSPYPHLEQYVATRTMTVTDPDVECVADDPAGLVRRLKRRPGLDIWLAGGGKLAAALADEIDELVVKCHPIVLGSGIPLFDGPCAPRRFTRLSARTFDSGVTVTTYGLG